MDRSPPRARSAAEAADPGAGGGATQGDRAVGIWLLTIAALVFVMVLLGGYTRLTNSGLSIVEWKPIHGTVPPLDAADWEEEFARYRESPEFAKVNTRMTLPEFQRIFWPEWIHRQFGRFIGLAFLLPFAVFWLQGRIRGALRWQTLGLFLLGALQGGIGWWMVASGLVDVPAVSPYRLAVHLVVAFAILVVALRLALRELGMRRFRAPAAARAALLALLGVGLQILSGVFVAGTDAGFRWNTYPAMDGALVPAGLYEGLARDGVTALSPLRAAFEDPLTVQFQHRVLAVVAVAAVLFAAWRARGAGAGGLAALAGLLVVFQALLGIATLLRGVPVSLGVAHQGLALVLLAALVALRYRLSAA